MCDIVCCDKKIEDFKTHLQQFRNNLDSSWNKIVRALPNTYSVKRNVMEPLEGEDKKSAYRWLSLVLDVMVINISAWFSDIPKLKLFSMLDHYQFTRFNAEFAANAMNCLAENCVVHFNLACLRNELAAVQILDFQEHVWASWLHQGTRTGWCIAWNLHI